MNRAQRRSPRSRCNSRRTTWSRIRCRKRSAEPEPVIGMVCPPDESEPLIVILTVFLSSVVRAPSITCAAASRDAGPLPPINEGNHDNNCQRRGNHRPSLQRSPLREFVDTRRTVEAGHVPVERQRMPLRHCPRWWPFRLDATLPDSGKLPSVAQFCREANSPCSMRDLRPNRDKISR